MIDIFVTAFHRHKVISRIYLYEQNRFLDIPMVDLTTVWFNILGVMPQRHNRNLKKKLLSS